MLFYWRWGSEGLWGPWLYPSCMGLEVLSQYFFSHYSSLGLWGSESPQEDTSLVIARRMEWQQGQSPSETELVAPKPKHGLVGDSKGFNVLCCSQVGLTHAVHDLLWLGLEMSTSSFAQRWALSRNLRPAWKGKVQIWLLWNLREADTEM